MPAQRRRAECGEPFEFLGTEDSEQVDWQVKITRIVWRRRRYREAVVHPGPQDGRRAAGGQAGAEGPVHRRVPGAAGV